MKYTVVSLAFATGVYAQSLSDIPSCALPCIDTARTQTTSCAADDYKCICDNINTLTAAATSCVLSACGADVATNQVLPAVQAFCAAVENGSSQTSATSAPTSAPTSTPTSTPSSTPTSETTSASTSEQSSESTTGPTSTSGSTSGSASGSASGPTSEPTVTSQSSSAGTTPSPTNSGDSPTATTSSTVPTAGAAAAGSVGGLAMFILGALAAFY
ncbi:hypothetical protein GGR51DRAFT_555267 [Nemania sp. FL0031]|nr:hypothetical protein GGR51DRAFT_555267 [Nemania sp. FL0031]